MVPEIAAGARDGGPFQMWSGQREPRSEGETSVIGGVLGLRCCKVQSWGEKRIDWKVPGRIHGIGSQRCGGWFVRAGWSPARVGAALGTRLSLWVWGVSLLPMEWAAGSCAGGGSSSTYSVYSTPYTGLYWLQLRSNALASACPVTLPHREIWESNSIALLVV